MRYTYLQTIEKKIQEMTEDRGSRKDDVQRTCSWKLGKEHLQ